MASVGEKNLADIGRVILEITCIEVYGPPTARVTCGAPAQRLR
jgi:hypothetical protein